MAENEKKKMTLWEQAVENALRFAFNLAFVFVFHPYLVCRMCFRGWQSVWA